MPKPQMENGYTPIPNELTEQLYKMRFNGTQFRIILAVIRFTYGFHCQKNFLAESFIVDATGINKVNVSQELNKLIKNNVITVVTERTNLKPRELSINLNFEQWKPPKIELVNLPTQNQFRVSQFTPSGVSKNTDLELVNSLTNKNNNKNNYKENILCAFFDLLWNLYPNKKGKSKVSKKALKEINSIGLETMKECIERYVNNKPEWRAWQHGSTFFNGGYKDYLIPEQTEPKEENKKPTGYGGTYL